MMRAILAICLLLTAVTAANAQRKRPSLTRAEIKQTERKLNELGYWTGRVDGILDAETVSAVIAFEKWEGRPATGKLTGDEFAAIQKASAPQARDLGYEHLEIDVDRQLLMLVSDNGRVRVLHVSTGNDKEFMYDGEKSVAYTPRGRFVVYDKTFGWEDGKIGSVYYANYISGGVAIHGYLSVPTQPASHGCIRIPMFAAREVSQLTPVGTIVLVYDKATFVSGKAWADNPKLKEPVLKYSALQ